MDRSTCAFVQVFNHRMSEAVNIFYINFAVLSVRTNGTVILCEGMGEGERKFYGGMVHLFPHDTDGRMPCGYGVNP